MTDFGRLDRSRGLLFARLFSYLFCAALMSESMAQTSSAGVPGKIIQVGAVRDVKTLAEAARLARDGDVVEVDAGDYPGDVAVWQQDRLKLRAVDGRARLIASGKSAEGKGIWVVRGGAISIEGFDFSGSRVSGANGAGIRLEKGQLRVKDCTFLDNENGILTANNPEITLEISYSEFGQNGAGDGQSHNLYVGSIKLLRVIGSHFHHARVGHLLKSRAAENYVLYNRLVDGAGGNASYELEFPAGGLAYVVGNVIEQAPETGNPHLISFGAEGYKWPHNELYLVNNTLVDRRVQGGVFLRVASGAQIVKAYNNLLLGKGSLESSGPGDFRGNFNVDRADFALAEPEPYRLKFSSRLMGKMTAPGSANGFDLAPSHEFRVPRQIKPVPAYSAQPGAIQTLGDAK